MDEHVIEIKDYPENHWRRLHGRLPEVRAAVLVDTLNQWTPWEWRHVKADWRTQRPADQ